MELMELTENDVLALSNNKKRKAVLANWFNWPILAHVPEIGLTVYKLDLPGGGAFTASWYDGDTYLLNGQKRHPGPCYHLIGWDGKLAHGSQGQSVFIEHLQNLRKQLMEAKKNG